MLGRNFIKFVSDVAEKQFFGHSKICSVPLHLINVQSIHYRSEMNKDEFNPKTREEINKLGLKEYMKKHRQYAQLNYQEWRYPEKSRAIDISCTRQIVDPYKVDDGGGISSLLKTPRSKLTDIRDDIFSYRILKKRVREFHRKRFPTEAQNIYLEVHNLLNTENWTVEKEPDTLDRLDKLVTEHAFPVGVLHCWLPAIDDLYICISSLPLIHQVSSESPPTDMVNGLNTKTLKWKYIETIEPPRVVKVRTPVMLTDNNYYGQVTVRFHSKQTLAIYDRFGRLMVGSPDLPRNVLEYVVFERHISHPYGMWRIHGKIPASQYREPLRRTVAVVKPNHLTQESKAWHKEEEEINTFKWYPGRFNALEKAERIKRLRRGQRYFKRRRGFKIFCIKHTMPTSIQPRVRRLIKEKRRQVRKLREEGRLPTPPKIPNP